MSSKKNKPQQVLITSSEPQKYPEYKVIVANSAEELSVFVNEHLKEGWGVSGGVSVCVETSPYHSRIILSQAMTK